MDTGIKNSIAFLGNLLSLNWLKSGRDYPPFLPFYHVVSDKKLDYINSYLVRTPQQFETELEYLLSHFTPVSLEELVASPQRNKMHLTFDDGLKECHSVIAPILKRKGIPATFFVSPGFVDNKSLFHRFKRAILEVKGVIPQGGKKYFLHETHELDTMARQHHINFSEYQPYLNLEEIRSLQNDGFTIGAHSLNHPEMWLLNEEEQYRQVAESMSWVVDHFNPAIKAFSFPFTDDGLKSSLFEKLKADKITDVTFGTAGLKYDQINHHFQRVPIERASNWSVKKVVHFEYFYFKIRNLFAANTVRRY